MRSFLKVLTMLVVGSIFLIVCPSINADERTGTLMVKINFINEDYSIDKAWIIKENFPALSAYGSVQNDLVFQLADFSQ